MRKLWTGDWVEHHGEFYDFAPVKMRPRPRQPIPIYVGGFSKAALRRAARNDGWIADLHTLKELEALIKEVRGYRAEAGKGRRTVQDPRLQLQRRVGSRMASALCATSA